MSAYITNDLTALTVAIWAAPEGTPAAAIHTLAQELRRENVKSVNYRYSETEPVEPVEPVDSNVFTIQTLRELGPVAGVGAARCQRYQSCEHPGWTTSVARVYCDLAEARAAAAGGGTGEDFWGISLNDLPANGSPE